MLSIEKQKLNLYHVECRKEILGIEELYPDPRSNFLSRILDTNHFQLSHAVADIAVTFSMLGL